MSKVSCGIDFGTTNSAVSIAKHSSTPEVVPLEGNNLTIPTAIFFEEDTNNVFYGSNALKNYIDGSRGRFTRYAAKHILICSSVFFSVARGGRLYSEK